LNYARRRLNVLQDSIGFVRVQQDTNQRWSNIEDAI